MLHAVAHAIPSFIYHLLITARLLLRTLGTPSDATWPGVKSLPDYKPSFPQWSGMPLTKAVPDLDEAGIDLLRGMLVYDPAGRVSGESFRLNSSLYLSFCSRHLI